MNEIIYGSLGIGIIVIGGFLFTYFEFLNISLLKKTKKIGDRKGKKGFSV